MWKLVNKANNNRKKLYRLIIMKLLPLNFRKKEQFPSNIIPKLLWYNIPMNTYVAVIITDIDDKRIHLLVINIPRTGDIDEGDVVIKYIPIKSNHHVYKFESYAVDYKIDTDDVDDILYRLRVNHIDYDRFYVYS
jgi:phosphatidylethanolamine-binding protein (PEBP) family uncharacterized protein